MGPEAETPKRSLRDRLKGWRHSRQPQISLGHHYVDQASAKVMREVIDEAQAKSAAQTPADQTQAPDQPESNKTETN